MRYVARMTDAREPSGAVIVAAGRGERVADGDPMPKQFRDLGGRSVLACAVAPFVEHGCDPIVVVASPDAIGKARTALGPHASHVTIVQGGASRAESARIGVEACDAALVHIHDGARPFVSNGQIERVEAALRADARAMGALPVLSVTDTVKRIGGDTVTGTVPRDTLGLAQTPQLVRRAAYLAAASAFDGQSAAVTDDVSLLESAGERVLAVAGDQGNVKITTATDLANARARLGSNSIPDVRVGHGYDTHRTTAGDHVWLCGLRIEAPFALDGHSDADIALHALTDALLGTCGEGDIGSHFPPTDPQWAGAASEAFLAHADAIVKAKGGRVTCADITIVCERPKIGPHRDRMRENIARILGLEIGRVSVKATTNERIGFVGRNEGIAGLATATVCYA